MSEAAMIVPKPPPAQAVVRDGGTQNRVTELRVSGHLMTLETGLFCVFQAPGSPAANDQSGLPGVRISLPPGPAGRPESVSISTFRVMRLGAGWVRRVRRWPWGGRHSTPPCPPTPKLSFMFNVLEMSQARSALGPGYAGAGSGLRALA